MTENCEKIRDQIALETGMPREPEVKAHVEACERCTQFLESLTAVEKELAALPRADVSEAVVEKLLARPELRRPAGTRRPFHWALGLAAAAMIGFVAFTVTLRSRDVARDAEIAVMNERPRVDLEQQDAAAPSGAATGLVSSLEDKDAKPKKQDAPSRDRRVRRQVEKELDEIVLKAPEARPEKTSPAREYDFRKNADNAREGGKGSISGRVEPPAASPPPPPRPAEEGLASAPADALEEIGAAGAGGFIGPPPEKRVDVEPEYPESAQRDGIQGTVELELTIDPEGNVVDAKLLHSIPALDEAALVAVRQWKYAPFDGKVLRSVVVEVPFELEEPDGSAARSFFEERARIDGLHFREARGYWANTYVPGDPSVRCLARRLEKAPQSLTPHAKARPVVQPFDAPSRGALSVFLHADRRGLSETSRLLVQVGLEATGAHGRRRPPMNVGLVVDTDAGHLPEMRALLDSLRQRKALGDRFRLVLAGRGEIVTPEAFRHGPLALALSEPSEGDIVDAFRLALTKVHAGDDPSMPLGTSLVVVATARPLDGALTTLAPLAHRSAVGGVPVSVVGVGEDVVADELERLTLAGQGRRYFLDRSEDADRIVDAELAATSRAVARAVRLRIKLAPGVQLVDVIGSEPLSRRQTKRVKDAEKSIDLRLARNLGIEADRGDDEDGIQIVIPSFYAGDSHTILLDVVASGPGPIAEVTARYKDLTELRNTVAKASLSLPRSSAEPGPLETNVLKNYLAFHLSRELELAADSVERGDTGSAVARLEQVRRLLSGLPFGNDAELTRDIGMLSEYVAILASRQTPVLLSYLADSLRYAGAAKLRAPAALT